MNRLDRHRVKLAILIEESGGQRELAERVGTAQSYISQLLTARGGIARKFCVRLEEATGKPDGWMDQWLPEESGAEMDDQPLSEAERKVLKMWRRMTPSVKRHVFSEMVKARAMPNLIASPNMTESELDAFVIETFSDYADGARTIPHTLHEDVEKYIRGDTKKGQKK